MVTIINRQRKYPLDIQSIKSDIQHILNILDYSDFDIGVLFTNNKTIRSYNKTYRHKDKPTDILSFSYHPELKAGSRIKVLTDEDKNLGDLIISVEYVSKAAQELGVSLEQRLQILFIHGICHLLGYDHETESDWRSMRAKEADIAKRIKP